jgi:hypothetical protein
MYVRECHSERICFDELLSDSERTYLDAYNKKWAEEGFPAIYGFPHLVPWLAYNLGDSGTTRATWTAVSTRLPTFRRNFQLYYFPAFRRWMTPRERLCAMGIPVFHDLAEAAGADTIFLDADASNQFAGNAMHFPNIALVVVAFLASVRLR